METVAGALGVYLTGTIGTYIIRREPHRLRKAVFWFLTVTAYAFTAFAVIVMIAGVAVVAALGESRFLPVQWLGGGITIVGLVGVLAYFGLLKILLWPTGEVNGG